MLARLEHSGKPALLWRKLWEGGHLERMESGVTETSTALETHCQKK
jgi:hypothetical protein